jgi:VWFA-related protein
MLPRRARLVVSTALVLAATLSSGSQGTRILAQTPTFRSGVKLIDIDVYVTDQDGQFVKNLTRDDFEIIEDGQPQDLQAITFVDLPFDTERRVPADANAPEPDVVTNQTVDGRLYVLLIDSPSTHDCPVEPYILLVRRTINRFIDDALQDGDLTAIVHVQGTFGNAQSFTTSKALLHESANKYGLGLSGPPELVTPEERMRRQIDSFQAIRDVAARLGAVTGRRKSIVWMGAQLMFDAPECTPSTPPSAGCRMLPYWAAVMSANREAISTANRNNVAVYSVDPCGLTIAMGRNELDRLAALRAVADDTGGLSVVNTNNFRDGFTNIVRDNSTYYVLGYVPKTEYRDGKFHPVTVRVKRPGLYTVRQRKGYMAAALEGPAADAIETPAGASLAAREALRMPVATRGVGVSLFNASFRGDAKSDSVLVGGKISADLLLDGAQQVGLSYQVFTQENHVQVGEYKTFTLNLQPDSRANVATSGLHFVERISLPPGRYEIRYAVDQPGGHVGSVVAPLIVPKFDDALSLSGVVLASDRTAAHFMLRDDAEIRERLGANPTSERAFHRGDLLNAYVEVYSDDARLTADDMTVTGILSTVDGKPVSRQDARLRSVVQSGDGRWAYTVEMDLADVPAGSYAVTLEAVSPRHKEPVRRVIPITVEE